MNKHYSYESLKSVAGDDIDFMAVVAQAFLDEIPPDLEALQQAISLENKELTYQFAHKMKPNMEMFGIKVMDEIKGIEAWTNTTKDKSIIADSIAHLSNVLKLVFVQLKEDFKL
jgi:HPt (histidine-containing phosphotransfer) domain-containing protein